MPCSSNGFVIVCDLTTEGTEEHRANSFSIQEVLTVQRVPLCGTESGVADDAAQLFFCCAIGHACGADYIFFEHHRADIVAAEAQAHLADLQSLRHPTGLHVEEI